MPPPPSALRGGLTPRQLRRVEHHLAQNLDGPLRLAELAAEAGLSASHFSRAFRQSTGTTPHAHVTAVRLEHARHLLVASDEPLGHIAAACGLADQAHLTRLFRRHLGETPGAFRRARRQAAPPADQRQLTPVHAG